VAEFARLNAAAPPPATLVEPQSERELEILQRMAKGLSNKEIAVQLYITEGTVKNHITNILGKLNVRDRTQAALKAKEIGLL
jgi:DNA-binding NarL/FixJ family response regulator